MFLHLCLKGRLNILRAGNKLWYMFYSNRFFFMTLSRIETKIMSVFFLHYQLGYTFYTWCKLEGHIKLIKTKEVAQAMNHFLTTFYARPWHFLGCFSALPMHLLDTYLTLSRKFFSTSLALHWYFLSTFFALSWHFHSRV